MIRFPRHVDIDLEPFKRTQGPLPTRYGLPEEVHFCKRCVVSNQRPASTVEFRHTKNSAKTVINFDEEGICDACRVAERKRQSIDWDAREAELAALCDRFRSNSGKYDCLIPGSGGKDSFYTAHMLKNKYGMHPLTVTWAPNMYTDWGRKNQDSWIHAGFDNFLVTPNGRTHRLLTRLAVENLLHPFQAFIMGQKQLAPLLARQFGIPLVIYGESEAEYGNPKGDADKAVRDAKFFSAEREEDMYLAGVSIADLKENFGIQAADLRLYVPPRPEEIAQSDIEVHYLGYYLKWHPQSCYYYSVEHGGFQASPERTAGTYSKYNSIDDKIDDFHYYTTWIKFGIGRATYDAAQEIRSGDIDRDEAVHLVQRFDGEYPDRFEKEIFQYLSLPEREFPQAAKLFEQPTMDRDYFMHLCDRFRSPHLWHHDNGTWKLRHTVWTTP